MQLYRTLDVFPEVPAMLHRLRISGFATAILSNGTPDMLADAVAHAGIGDSLDYVLSVEEVGVREPVVRDRVAITTDHEPGGRLKLP